MLSFCRTGANDGGRKPSARSRSLRQDILAPVGRSDRACAGDSPLARPRLALSVHQDTQIWFSYEHLSSGVRCRVTERLRGHATTPHEGEERNEVSTAVGWGGVWSSVVRRRCLAERSEARLVGACLRRCPRERSERGLGRRAERSLPVSWRAKRAKARRTTVGSPTVRLSVARASETRRSIRNPIT